MFSAHYDKVFNCDVVYFEECKRDTNQFNLNVFMINFCPKLDRVKFDSYNGALLNLGNSKIFNNLIADTNIGTKEDIESSRGLSYGVRRTLLKNVKSFRLNLLMLDHLKDTKEYDSHLLTTVHISDEVYDSGRRWNIIEAARLGNKYVHYKIKENCKNPSNSFARLVYEKSSNTIKHYIYPYGNERWQFDSDFIRGPHIEYSNLLLTFYNLESMFVLNNNLYSEALRNQNDNSLLEICCNNPFSTEPNTYYAPDGKGILYNEQTESFALNLIELKVSYVLDDEIQLQRENKWIEQIVNNLGVYRYRHYLQFLIKNNIVFIDKNGDSTPVSLEMLQKREESTLCKDIEIFTQYSLRNDNEYFRDVINPILWGNVVDDDEDAEKMRSKLLNDFFNNLIIHYTLFINDECKLTARFIKRVCESIEAFGCIPHIYKVYRYEEYDVTTDNGTVKYSFYEITNGEDD